MYLQDYIKIANIHADRLKIALDKLESLLPITLKTFSIISPEQLGLFDMLTTRFGKLQDTIGARIFSMILESLLETSGGETLTFIDKLNRLEKIDYLDDANWWIELRDIRNQLTHDYPDSALLCDHLNKLIPIAHELLNYWASLKEKIKKLK